MSSADRKADRVADDLLRRIVAGELAPGDLLPRENELAAEYGVNRGVVREAIKLLEVHRLVRPRRRVGTEVLDPLASLSPEVIRAMLRPVAGGPIDRGMLSDLLELRARVDEAMVALAAERRTAADLAELERCLAGLRAASGDVADYSRALDRFGLTLARATGNRLYVMLIHWHRRVVEDLGELIHAVRRPSEPHLQGVETLLELIRAREPEAARALVAAFHAWATPRLLEALAPAPSPSARDERAGASS